MSLNALCCRVAPNDAHTTAGKKNYRCYAEFGSRRRGRALRRGGARSRDGNSSSFPPLFLAVSFQEYEQYFIDSEQSQSFRLTLFCLAILLCQCMCQSSLSRDRGAAQNTLFTISWNRNVTLTIELHIKIFTT